MSNVNSIWCMTQLPHVVDAGFAMPASAGSVAPRAGLVSIEATRDRHAVATKQHPGTLVWSPPT